MDYFKSFQVDDDHVAERQSDYCHTGLTILVDSCDFLVFDILAQTEIQIAELRDY
jgi:hypothetical protein